MQQAWSLDIAQSVDSGSPSSAGWSSPFCASICSTVGDLGNIAHSSTLPPYHVLTPRRSSSNRRREQRIAQGSVQLTAGVSSSAGLGPPRDSVRGLAVAALGAAEASSFKIAPAPSGKSNATISQIRADKLPAALTLDTWAKPHPHLQAVTLEQGEASVALLFLWEADHWQLYTCEKVDICVRLNSGVVCLS